VTAVISARRSSYQCGNSVDLHRQCCDGDVPLMVITDEVFLKLLVMLKHDVHTLNVLSAVFINAKHVTSVKQQLQYYFTI